MTTGTGSEPDSHVAHSLAQAEESARLGLPIPPGTRMRTPKRLLARISRLITHRQVAYNVAIVDAVTDLHASVESLRTAVSETAKSHELADVRSDLIELAEQLTRLEQRVAQLVDAATAPDDATEADRHGLRLAVEDPLDVAGD